MDIQSLPQYRGLPESLRAWGQPDDRGLLPSMHLRDYLAACVLIGVCILTLLPVGANLWKEHYRIWDLDGARRGQHDEELFLDTFGR